MNTINFYDKERNLIIQLKDFQFVKTEALKIVTFKGKVDFDFFHIETNFEAEEYDFTNLQLSLEKMYNGEQNYISFNPFSGKLTLKLSEEGSQIKIKGEVYNDLSTCKLEFKYNIDQSFIPELIKELKEMMMREDM
ncbi:MAG TPA: hypothetical protein PLJ84_07150 [Bacteroidales bacterium]|nr:hypothetical protein [Bacteroidales bacterium]HPT02360.1 hypothetical protein [Bacteroidales bacterium]